LRPLLVNLSTETDPANSVRMLRQYLVDGVIVASSTLPPSFAAAFRDAGLPVVHSFGRYSTAPHVHVVGIDNIACGRMAAQTLIARGYARVAFLGGPEQATSTQDRERGFLEVLRAEPDVSVSVSYARAYSFDAGRQEMARLLREGSLPDAFFCGDDVLSLGALSALQEAGLHVPKDVGLIGLNDMAMARWQIFDLTTIRQPIADIIAASIDLVVSSLDSPDCPPVVRLFPCEVIERGTLRPVPR
jgi:DNA-binding LacI/PurR family transcriptional regulator